MALRYNNPGNIRTFLKNGEWSKPFIGEILPPLFTPGKNSGYRKFQTLPFGYRALFMVLKNNYLDKGINTIQKIFPVYAPASDNNQPSVYINTVEKKTGINRNKILSTYKDLIPIVEAITEIETGQKADKTAIMQGYEYINKPPVQIEPQTEQTPTEPKKKNWFIKNKKPILITTAVGAVLTALYLYNEKETHYS